VEAARTDAGKESVSAPLSPEKQARLAKAWDDEIAPAYASRFAALLLRHVHPTPGARVVEIGCATGQLTRELSRRFDVRSRITAFDEADAFVAEASARMDGVDDLRAPIALRVGEPQALPADDASANLVVSNLAVAAAADPGAAAEEIGRVLAPGGTAIITAPLRGTWAEFLDLFRDVLRESGKVDRLTAVDRHVAGLPDGERVAGWLQRAGLVNVGVDVERWEILFKTSREFLFAPLVELGPLSQWKRLAGAGDDLQDAFFFTKEAIDTYFKGRPFATTVFGAVAWGQKRR
jgi:ubiquinone/menaquinone biosynthesis C-methylase UbiE